MRFGKWDTIRELNRGGQGIVFLAFDTTALNLSALLSQLRQTLAGATGGGTPETNAANARQLLELIETYLNRESGAQCGALKILHESARTDAKARTGDHLLSLYRGSRRQKNDDPGTRHQRHREGRDEHPHASETG